jgi:hypothetical protein
LAAYTIDTRESEFSEGTGRKANSGTGVERSSLPRDFEKSRNAAVITAQTV